MSLIFDKKVLYEAIKMPMEYLIKQSDLGQKIFCQLDGKSEKEIDEKLQALIEFHSQIIDNLHVIERSLGNGFPVQAAILTATIYELSHKGIYVFNNPEALKIWLNPPNFKQDFEKELAKAMKPNQKKPNISIKEIVEDNVQKSCTGKANLEYGVYKQLCRFKHPHPIFCRLVADDKNVYTICGNRSDSQAIQHSWFIACNASRYAGCITKKMLENYPNLFSADLTISQEDVFKRLNDIDVYIDKNHPSWKRNPFE